MRGSRARQVIGEDNWEAFMRWMRGQTYAQFPDGEADYYDCDVNAFKKKLDTGYDRQVDPIAWD